MLCRMFRSVNEKREVFYPAAVDPPSTRTALNCTYERKPERGGQQRCRGPNVDQCQLVGGTSECLLEREIIDGANTDRHDVPFIARAQTHIPSERKRSTSQFLLLRTGCHWRASSLASVLGVRMWIEDTGGSRLPPVAHDKRRHRSVIVASSFRKRTRFPSFVINLEPGLCHGR